MNKILLQKLIREEIKNLSEQGKFNYQPLAKQMSRDAKSADSEQAIQKMADALDLDVSIRFGTSYNKIEFIQKQDVDEKPFEQMIQFLEKIGYNVDLGQSDRIYDFEPGERNIYPRIIFSK